MQCELKFPLVYVAYDFNQLIYAVFSLPRRFRPSPPIDFWPCPAPPGEKEDSPSIPGILAPKGPKKTQNTSKRAKNRLTRAKCRGLGPKNTSFCFKKKAWIRMVYVAPESCQGRPGRPEGLPRRRQGRSPGSLHSLSCSCRVHWKLRLGFYIPASALLPIFPCILPKDKSSYFEVLRCWKEVFQIILR